MKKNEPLKEKVIVGDPHEGIKFKFEDVKSAVHGLLDEIEKAIKYYTIQNALNESTFRNERIEGLKIAQELIKKWFPDVLEEVDEKWK